MSRDNRIPPTASELICKYRDAFRAVHGETVEVTYRDGAFYIAGQHRGVSASLLEQWTSMLTQKAAESRPLHVCEDALKDEEPQPVAWQFELARARVYEDGKPVGWTDWGPPQLSFTKPHVPEGSIRNLQPLFAWEGDDNG